MVTFAPSNQVGRQPAAPPARIESDTLAIEQLADEIAGLAAHIHAATYRLLTCLREFDDRNGWGGGFRSCAHWLSWRTGIAPGAAREKVRVARALADLPLLSEAMRRGELSFARARALTRVASPANEAELLEVARHATAAQTEKIVRAWRRVDTLEARLAGEEAHERRSLTYHIDDDGCYVLHGRLDPEVGALFERALADAMLALRTARAESATDYTGAQRRADALALVCERALAQDPSEQADAVDAGRAGDHIDVHDAACARGSIDPRRRPDPRSGGRYEVVLHVDADHAVLESGQRVSAETSRRLMCDAARVVMYHAADGSQLDVGRRTRTVPPAIRRALEHRDRGCRFPGCGVRYCDAHHIRHWSQGGATRIDNLVLLCRRHHRMLHEGGCHVEVTPHGLLKFTDRYDRAIPEVPALPELATDIEALNAAADVSVDAGTISGNWIGQYLDIDYALRSLREFGNRTEDCSRMST